MVDAIALLPKEAIPPRSSPETAQAIT